MATNGSMKQRVDADGVRITESPGVRKGVWLLVLAMCLISVALIVIVRPALYKRVAEPPIVPRDEVAAAVNRSVPQPAGAHDTGRLPKAFHAVPIAGAQPPHSSEKPTVPSAARQPGVAPEQAPPAAQDVAPPSDEAAENEPSGIALFPPPGTKPIKRGIVVPEGFELPPGYVRHYQATDDGRRLPAILMFHPDYQFVDEHGAPVPVPENRVVPPELAPAGLPIEMLEVPDAQTNSDLPRDRGTQEPEP